MKILKIIFSKVFLVAISLLAQVWLIFATIFYFNKYYHVIQIITIIIGILTILYIINKEETPEFKLPWIIVIICLPLFGLTIYFLFANPRMPMKEVNRSNELISETSSYFANNEHLNSKYSHLTKYLERNVHVRGSYNNKVTYFSLGEEFHADLLKELKKAKHFIFMEYFIISKGEMWDSIHQILLEKIKEGVEIRLIYDDIGSAGYLENSFYKKLQKEGIKCVKFNSFRPFISGVYNNRDHRKITVIDGKVAYTGGINIGDEYINKNKRLGHWKDTAIKIEGIDVRNLTCIFLNTYDLITKSLSDYDEYLDVEFDDYKSNGYTYSFGDGPKPFYKEQIGENNFINMINSAKKSVYITTPYLICDYHLMMTLKMASERGVDVRIITPYIPDKKIILNMTRSSYKTLLESGVKIYEYTPGFMHAKMVVCDGKVAFIGTINFDYRSLVHHYECGTLLIENECIEKMNDDFKELFKISKEINLDNFYMGIIKKLIAVVLRLFTPML